MATRINLLTIAGVGLGVLSLNLPWAVRHTLGYTDEYMLVQKLLPDSGALGLGFAVSITVFVLGIFLALLTPSSGFLQLAGMGGFFLTSSSALGHYSGNPTTSAGAYVGLASALVVTISFFLPIGIGYVRKKWSLGETSWPDRLLTVCTFSKSAKLRINLLCVSGALLGFVAMALPWILESERIGAGVWQHYDLNWYFYADRGVDVVALVVFLVGSAMAFLTPLGGLFQLAGVLSFATSRSGDIRTITAGEITQSLEWGVGLFFAVISSAIVIASLFVPIGIGYESKRRSIGKAFLAWGEAEPAYIRP